MKEIKKEEGWRWGLLSLILIVLLIAATCSTMGQVGLNGAGFFENRTEQSDEWLSEVSGEWVLRVPGGAIAKYAVPSPERGGWGMDSATVDSITFKYKSFEEEQTNDILGKWYRKTANQPKHSYLDELIEFSQIFDIEVIWVLNLYIDPQLAIFPVEYLLLNGVDIIGVEMGNESYSQVNHDFAEYSKRVDMVAPMVRALGLKVYHPAAPSGTRFRPDHADWNFKLNQAYGTEGFVFHPYFDRREFSALAEPVDTLLAFQQINAFDFEAFWGDLRGLFPNAGSYIVTETNSQPARLIGGTGLNARLVERILETGKENLDVICLHNGVSPDIYGIIYGKEGEQVKNTTFEVWKQQVCVESIRPECIKCQRFFYRLFNWKACNTCGKKNIFVNCK